MVSRIKQPLIIVPWKLRIDGQPHGLALEPTAWKLDGKVHPLVTPGASFHLFTVLLGGQDLLEQRLQLGLAKDASGLDVGEHALQVPHPLRQGLHVPQALVDLLEALGDLFKALAQTLLQGRLQLFVHGVAHLIELLGIARQELLQLSIQGLANLKEALRVALAQGVHLGAQGVTQTFLQDPHLLGLAGLELAQALLHFHARLARRVRDLASHIALKLVEFFLQLLELHHELGVLWRPWAAQH